jgi:hypothetical protein
LATRYPGISFSGAASSPYFARTVGYVTSYAPPGTRKIELSGSRLSYSPVKERAMRKHIRYLLPLVAVLFCACEGFDLASEQLRGSGKVATEQRPVLGTNAVTLAGVGALRIEVGDQESLRIEADDNILPHIKTRVENGKLTIGVERGFSVHPSVPIRYSLIVRQLDEVGLSGSGKISTAALRSDTMKAHLSGSGEIAFDELTGREFAAGISGSGEIKASGRVEAVEVDISGSGGYYGGDLQSRTAEVIVSGSGNSRLWVTDALTVHVSGSGDVEYYGNPGLTQHVSGSGKLISRGSK